MSYTDWDRLPSVPFVALYEVLFCSVARSNQEKKKMFPIKCYARNCFHEEKSEVFSQWTSWTFKKKQDSKIEINVYPTQLLILKCKLHLDFVITLAGGHCGLRGFFFTPCQSPI